LIEVRDEAEVRAITPDFCRLATIKKWGHIVTAQSKTSEADFVYRFFAPYAGIDEDPATGGVQCVLAPYWCARLGKDFVTSTQLSRRGGKLEARLAGERVMIGGEAKLYLQGSIQIS
jgi:predicted PhzF superfamily epimerase YddE/YHI9